MTYEGDQNINQDVIGEMIKGMEKEVAKTFLPYVAIAGVIIIYLLTKK